MIKMPHPREPGVQLDTSIVRQIEKCRLILTEQIVDRTSRGSRGHACRLHPTRKVGRHILVKKTLSLDAIGMAVERLGSVEEMRQKDRRDLSVVLDDIALS